MADITRTTLTTSTTHNSSVRSPPNIAVFISWNKTECMHTSLTSVMNEQICLPYTKHDKHIYLTLGETCLFSVMFGKSHDIKESVWTSVAEQQRKYWRNRYNNAVTHIIIRYNKTLYGNYITLCFMTPHQFLRQINKQFFVDVFRTYCVSQTILSLLFWISFYISSFYSLHNKHMVIFL